MSTLLKNLLITLGISITLFMGYLMFVRDGGGDDSLLQSETSADVELQTQELLTALGELESIDVGGEVFQSPLFLSFKDFRQDLGEEKSGRANPFAPVQ